jgi:hypothetical protein
MDHESGYCGESQPNSAGKSYHETQANLNQTCRETAASGLKDCVSPLQVVRDLRARQRQLEAQKQQVSKQLQIVSELLGVFEG